MPSITWSGTFTAGNYGGNAWSNIYSLTSNSALPSNAVINSITYSVNSYIGLTSLSGNFQLYAIAINNGPYTTSNYSSGSATTLTDTITATKNTSGSFQGGTYSIEADPTYPNARTRLYLNDCTFGNTSSVSAFSSTNISAKIRLNKSGNGTHYITGISVTVTYSTPSLNPPTNFKIVGSTSSYTGTFASFTWSAASWSNGGSGTIYYRLLELVDGEYYITLVSGVSSGVIYLPDSSGDQTTMTIYLEAYSGSYTARTGPVTFYYKPLTTPTLSINGLTTYTGSTATITWTASSVVGTQSSGATIKYILLDVTDGSRTEIYNGTARTYTYNQTLTQGTTKKFKLHAYSENPDGAESSDSNEVVFIYDNRSISAPTLRINGSSSYTGPTIPLTWNTPSSTGLSGDIIYHIYIDNIEITSVTNNTSITITSGVSSYAGVNITITAERGGFISPVSNSVTYTYLNPDKTIGYYNGSSWVNCVIYYYNGTSWIKCDPYYFNGTSWVLCSTK